MNVGIIFVGNQSTNLLTVGYENTASAVLIARDTIIRQQILPGVTLK